MSSKLHLAVALLTALSPLAGQGSVVFDSFNTASIDRSKWVWLPGANFQQSGGALQLRGRGISEFFAFEALSGFEGDFVVEWDFSGFVPGSLGAAFWVWVFDPEAPQGADALLGMGSWSQNGRSVVGVQAELVSGNNYYGNETVSSATAGTLRIARKGAAVDVSYRFQGQTGFTSLSSLNNLFVSNYASFGMEIEPNSSGGVDVDIEEVRITGKLVSGLKVVGDGCDGALLITNGYPRINNPLFELFLVPADTLTNKPFIAAVGAPLSAPISLAAAGAPGCNLYVDPNISILFAGRMDSSAEGSVPLPIPNSASLRGLSILCQYAVESPANSMGLAWSNGLMLTVF